MKTSFTREGFLYILALLLLFVGAALREVNLLLLLASLLCCPVLIAWRLGRSQVSRIDVHRVVPTHVHAGEMFVVAFDMHCHGPHYGAWSVVIEDTIRFLRGGSRSARPMRPAVYFEYLGPGRRQRKTYAGILPQRGCYVVGPVTVSTQFPFGLFRTWRNGGTDETTKERARNVPGEKDGKKHRDSSDDGRPEENGAEFVMTVFPRLGTLSTRWLARQHEATESRHRRRLRSSRTGGEFLGLRDWRQGDLRRWIHWRASVRHNSLIVRQFEQHQNHDAVVLLDLFPGVSPTLHERENTELAVSLTATLLREMSRQSASNLTLGFHGDSVDIISGTTCTPLIDAMFQALAVIEPASEDRLAELLTRALGSVDSHGDIFLVTTRPLDILASERLASLHDDPRFRPFANRIRLIDTSDENLDTFFTLE